MSTTIYDTPDSKVHGANMGPIWGQQDPGGPHVGPMNFAIWDHMSSPGYNQLSNFMKTHRSFFYHIFVHYNQIIHLSRQINAYMCQ